MGTALAPEVADNSATACLEAAKPQGDIKEKDPPQFAAAMRRMGMGVMGPGPAWSSPG